MKKYLALITLTVLSVACYGQAAKQPASSTTDEEYNYLTKGYKVQIESGLDMKRGYSLVDISDDIERGSYTFNFKFLVREEKDEIGAMLAVIKSSVSGRVYYLCIPYNNATLNQQYRGQLALWDSSLLTEYAFASSSIFSNMMIVQLNEE